MQTLSAKLGEPLESKIQHLQEIAGKCVVDYPLRKDEIRTNNVLECLGCYIAIIYKYPEVGSLTIYSKDVGDSKIYNCDRSWITGNDLNNLNTFSHLLLKVRGTITDN
jgi:hypothetical protein